MENLKLWMVNKEVLSLQKVSSTDKRAYLFAYFVEVFMPAFQFQGKIPIVVNNKSVRLSIQGNVLKLTPSK